MIRPTTAALLAIAALVAVPPAASAQGLDVSSCGQWAGVSRTTAEGGFAARPDEVVELRSERDGVVIQVGIVRPDGPSHAPVIALASTYQPVDYAHVDLAKCQPWFVENFVPHGYAVALISVRGTGNSGGCQNLLGPLEQADISQAITWLGTREWSNGSVGLYGLSYDAATNWSAAATGNPHLKTILPASGLSDLFDLAFGAGTYDFRWWLFVPGYYHLYATIESNPAAGHAPDRWFESVARCPDLDAAYQATAESLATGERDSRGYWAERNHKPGIEQRWRGSVLLIQGLQDWNVRPANNIPWVPELQRRGVEVKQLLGQWGHTVPDYKHAHTRWDFADLALRWFDRYLKGDRSVDTGPAVEVQDTSGRWRGEDQWPPASTTSYALGGSAHSEALLAPDSRSRHYYISDVAPFQTTDDWLPVPGAVEELCATCAAFSWDAPDGLRISGIPQVRLKATPTGPTGHVAAVLYRRNRERGLKRIGWGMTDLRFPEGEGASSEKPRTVTAGEPVDVTIRLEPMEAIVEKGEQLVLVLGQGQSAQQPGRPPMPVRVALGADRASLHLALVDPPADRFFTPPGPPTTTDGGRTGGGRTGGGTTGGGTTGGPTGLDTRPASRRFLISRRALKLRRGTARVVVSCRQSTPCRGTLRLRASVRRGRGSRLRRIIVGRRDFTVPAGRRTALRVRISRTGRRYVARARRGLRLPGERRGRRLLVVANVRPPAGVATSARRDTVTASFRLVRARR